MLGFFITEIVTQIGLRGLETAESASAVSMRPRKPIVLNEYLELLDEFEDICETEYQGPRVW
jgi:hypothetical protein